ncbi:hypothetical protein [Aliivibrio fischeri]|uniref:hypothetical protein n=1 Tax=Aliivibrio fischeri TaxID=668 RepID=UPI0012DAA171|nr:hypothetical protein [Aliivibrio fischeri]MUK69389.1 hypothetical protein [Aliivibrio fischeri]
MKKKTKGSFPYNVLNHPSITSTPLVFASPGLTSIQYAIAQLSLDHHESVMDFAFEYLQHANLSQAKEFRTRGYNRFLPQFDFSLRDELEQHVQRLESDIELHGININSDQLRDVQIIAGKLRSQIECISQVQDQESTQERVEKWIEAHVPKKIVGEARPLERALGVTRHAQPEEHYGSRKVAQSLVRRLEGALKAMSLVAQSLSELVINSNSEQYDIHIERELIREMAHDYHRIAPVSPSPEMCSQLHEKVNTFITDEKLDVKAEVDSGGVYEQAKEAYSAQLSEEELRSEINAITAQSPKDERRRLWLQIRDERVASALEQRLTFQNKACDDIQNEITKLDKKLNGASLPLINNIHLQPPSSLPFKGEACTYLAVSEGLLSNALAIIKAEKLKTANRLSEELKKLKQYLPKEKNQTYSMMSIAAIEKGVQEIKSGVVKATKAVFVSEPVKALRQQLTKLEKSVKDTNDKVLLVANKAKGKGHVSYRVLDEKCKDKKTSQLISDSIVRSILWQLQQSMADLQQVAQPLLSSSKMLAQIKPPLPENFDNEFKSTFSLSPLMDILLHKRHLESPEMKMWTKQSTLNEILVKHVEQVKAAVKALETNERSDSPIDILAAFKLSFYKKATDLSNELISALDLSLAEQEEINNRCHDLLMVGDKPLLERMAKTQFEVIELLNQAVGLATSSPCHFSQIKDFTERAILKSLLMKVRLAERSAQETGRDLDDTSRGARIAKHWAMILAEKIEVSQALPSPGEVLALINRYGLNEETHSSGDPKGALMATRLSAELARAQAGTLLPVMAPERYAKYEKDLVEFMVAWGQRRFTRGMTEHMFELALSIPTTFMFNIFSPIYRLPLASLRIPYKVYKTKSLIMPGSDKPYKAIDMMVKKRMKQLGFHMVTSPMPTVMKTALGGVLAGAGYVYNKHVSGKEQTLDGIYEQVVNGEQSQQLRMDSMGALALRSVTALSNSGFEVLSDHVQRQVLTLSTPVESFNSPVVEDELLDEVWEDSVFDEPMSLELNSDSAVLRRVRRSLDSDESHNVMKLSQDEFSEAISLSYDVTLDDRIEIDRQYGVDALKWLLTVKWKEYFHETDRADGEIIREGPDGYNHNIAMYGGAWQYFGELEDGKIKLLSPGHIRHIINVRDFDSPENAIEYSESAEYMHREIELLDDGRFALVNQEVFQAYFYQNVLDLDEYPEAVKDVIKSEVERLLDDGSIEDRAGFLYQVNSILTLLCSKNMPDTDTEDYVYLMMAKKALLNKMIEWSTPLGDVISTPLSVESMTQIGQRIDELLLKSQIEESHQLDCEVLEVITQEYETLNRCINVLKSEDIINRINHYAVMNDYYDIHFAEELANEVILTEEGDIEALTSIIYHLLLNKDAPYIEPIGLAEFELMIDRLHLDRKHKSPFYDLIYQEKPNGYTSYQDFNKFSETNSRSEYNQQFYDYRDNYSSYESNQFAVLLADNDCTLEEVMEPPKMVKTFGFCARKTGDYSGRGEVLEKRDNPLQYLPGRCVVMQLSSGRFFLFSNLMGNIKTTILPQSELEGFVYCLKRTDYEPFHLNLTDSVPSNIKSYPPLYDLNILAPKLINSLYGANYSFNGEIEPYYKIVHDSSMDSSRLGSNASALKVFAGEMKAVLNSFANDAKSFLDDTNNFHKVIKAIVPLYNTFYNKATDSEYVANRWEVIPDLLSVLPIFGAMGKGAKALSSIGNLSRQALLSGLRQGLRGPRLLAYIAIMIRPSVLSAAKQASITMLSAVYDAVEPLPIRAGLKSARNLYSRVKELPTSSFSEFPSASRFDNVSGHVDQTNLGVSRDGGALSRSSNDDSVVAVSLRKNAILPTYTRRTLVSHEQEIINEVKDIILTREVRDYQANPTENCKNSAEAIFNQLKDTKEVSDIKVLNLALWNQAVNRGADTFTNHYAIEVKYKGVDIVLDPTAGQFNEEWHLGIFDTKDNWMAAYQAHYDKKRSTLVKIAEVNNVPAAPFQSTYEFSGYDYKEGVAVLSNAYWYKQSSYEQYISLLPNNVRTQYLKEIESLDTQQNISGVAERDGFLFSPLKRKINRAIETGKPDKAMKRILSLERMLDLSKPKNQRILETIVQDFANKFLGDATQMEHMNIMEIQERWLKEVDLPLRNSQAISIKDIVETRQNFPLMIRRLRNQSQSNITWVNIDDALNELPTAKLSRYGDVEFYTDNYLVQSVVGEVLGNINIFGSSESIELTKMALDEINSTFSGKRLLEDLGTNNIQIQLPPMSEVVRVDENGQIFAKNSSDGKMKVSFDPENRISGSSVEDLINAPYKERDPSVALFHELLHIYNSKYPLIIPKVGGGRLKVSGGSSLYEESRIVGGQYAATNEVYDFSSKEYVDQYRQNGGLYLTENMYRREHAINKGEEPIYRPYYGTGESQIPVNGLDNSTDFDSYLLARQELEREGLLPQEGDARLETNPSLQAIHGFVPYTKPKGKKYIFFPFMNDERVNSRLIPILRDKGVSSYEVVFRNQEQIDQFVDILTRTYGNKATSSLETKFHYLYDLNKTDLSDLTKEDTLYISGHGQPGDGAIYGDSSDKALKISVGELADDIEGMLLPHHTTIKVATCNSAVGNPEGISAPVSGDVDHGRLYSQFTDSQQMGDFNNSLAGQLENHLSLNGRENGKVFGYLGYLTSRRTVTTMGKIVGGKLEINTFTHVGAGFYDSIGRITEFRRSDMMRGRFYDPNPTLGRHGFESIKLTSLPQIDVSSLPLNQEPKVTQLAHDGYIIHSYGSDLTHNKKLYIGCFTNEDTVRDAKNLVWENTMLGREMIDIVLMRKNWKIEDIIRALNLGTRYTEVFYYTEEPDASVNVVQYDMNDDGTYDFEINVTSLANNIA